MVGVLCVHKRNVIVLVIGCGISDMEYYLNEFLMEFVYNSEAIEGLKASHETVKSVIMNGYGKDLGNNWIDQLRTHYYIASEIRELNPFLHIGTIKSWHERLFKNVLSLYDCGNFRTCQVGISGSDQVLAQPEFVYRLMGDFLTKYNNYNNFTETDDEERYTDPIYKGIGFRHYQFEKIHPFVDGNGRIGRLIMLHDLNRHKLLFKMIRKITVDKYYTALAAGEEEFGEYFMKLEPEGYIRI